MALLTLEVGSPPLVVGDCSLEGSGSSLPVSRQRSSTSVLATSASRSSCRAPKQYASGRLAGYKCTRDGENI